ncbi:MAG: CCA tRNA nucleotidyltransferase [Kiloniellales bacterium]|nr:CCA tRNA nucleotidyltransferase [Kiloniellales bacterium]
MKPGGRLDEQEWMTAPETRAVVEALTAEGTEVRFVGGCVRDAVAGRPVRDIDLATPDPPEKVIALLEAAGLKAVPTGLAHGTVTAVSSHQPFEVTTLRRDVETDGRRATVAFTDDWEADAARRDFTFNALSCGIDGRLFDPFGGHRDLIEGRVRFVGEARQRIAEDYLRLLRFFRFHAFYGRGEPDPEGLKAAAAAAGELTRLSGERVRAELLRLLQANNPVPVLEVMDQEKILASVLPELGAPDVLKSLLSLGIESPRPDTLLRLGALLRSDPAAVAERLRLSNAERDRLIAMAGHGATPRVDMPERELRRAIYRDGGTAIRDRLCLAWAVHPKGPDSDAAHRNLALAVSWSPPRFPIKGRDALDLGLAPGASLGTLLEAVEAWWVEQDFEPSREHCLARLRDLAAAS